MMKTRRDVFQAIADPTRRAILLLLASQPLTAGAIASNFDSARPTISKHIKILTECELVQFEQKGREIFYEVNTSKVDTLDEWLQQFKEIWQNRFSELDSVLKRLKNE